MVCRTSFILRDVAVLHIEGFNENHKYYSNIYTNLCFVMKNDVSARTFYTLNHPTMTITVHCTKRCTTKRRVLFSVWL